MLLEIFLGGGTALILGRPRLERGRTWMQFRMPGNTTALLECLADSKRFARCSAADFGPRTRLNFSCSRRKNRRGSASAACEADCFRELFPRMPPPN